MGKKRCLRLVVEGVPAPGGAALSEGVEKVYLAYLRRRLEEAALPPDQGWAVVDALLAQLRAGE